MNYATTTLQQLGGSRFVAMTGAQCCADGRTLIIKLPRALVVTITLDPSDTYTMKTGKRATMKQIFSGKPAVTWQHTDCMLYADMLARTFTERTGLHTGL